MTDAVWFFGLPHGYLMGLCAGTHPPALLGPGDGYRVRHPAHVQYAYAIGQTAMGTPAIMTQPTATLLPLAELPLSAAVCWLATVLPDDQELVKGYRALVQAATGSRLAMPAMGNAGRRLH